MNFAFNWINKLLEKPTKTNLMALNKILTLGIPFNAPHGFKIKEASDEQIVINLPNRKLNHNHLGGIHACAMATVGEYCAGIALLKTFGVSNYRIILSELNINYTYQGRMDCVGICSPKQIDREYSIKKLNEEGKLLQTLETKIQDLNHQQIATVTSTWQLKPWDQVKTKQ